MIERNPAIDQLVAILRQIHAASGKANGGARGTASATSANAFARARPSLPEALEELLLRGPHQRVPPTELQGAALYQALQERVRQTEATILDHHAAIDRLLRQGDSGGTDPAPRPTLTQETLYLQCPRAGRTAGRFRCVNRADATVRAQVRPAAVMTPHGDRVEGAVITVAPRAPTLGAGEAALITVALDLRCCSAVAADHLESSVDVEIEGASMLKVWIAIDLYEPTT
jgi:hypothetical protein